MATTVELLVMAMSNHPKCEDVAVKKWSLGTLRNYDVDGEENVKKAIGLMRKTTTLHVHHAFCTFLCLHCTTAT